MFSQRTGWEHDQGALALEASARRAAGRPVCDLTRSNPTECGFAGDAGVLAAVWPGARSLHYEPDPRGALRAREAVARYYADHGASVSPDDVVLTASTSEAYSFLFHLLCDPGDEVLVPQPSYPLFGFLADLADVQLRPYPLFYDFGWWIDFDRLERALTGRTKAVVVVHPNNPTGHATTRRERRRLEEFCLRHDLALLADEVFLDYGIAGKQGSAPHNLRSFAVRESQVLSFVLSGLSKVAALPQMKVGWIVAGGADAPRREALARLEVVADTFLSVNTPAQLALPAWLKTRHGVQAAIRKRIQANLSTLQRSGLDTLTIDAGWAAILRLPATQETTWAQHLVRRGVLVHPGEFFGIVQGHRVVVSLLPPEAEFAAGAALIAGAVAKSAFDSGREDGSLATSRGPATSAEETG